MRNKLSVVLFTAFLLGVMSASLCYAADNLHPRTTFKLDRAPKYMIPYEPAGVTYPVTRPLGQLKNPPTNSPGNVAGETTYDYQHNGSMGRQVCINDADRVIFIVWMGQDDWVIPGNRNIFAQAWNPVDGYMLEAGGQQATTDYSGYTSCEFSPDDGIFGPPASFGCHTEPGTGTYATTYYWDGLPNEFIWYSKALLQSDTSSCLADEIIWPIMGVHHGDSSQVTEDVVYLLGHVFEGSEYMVLYRRIGDVWDSGQCLPQVTDLSYTIVPDPNSDYVAAVFSDDRHGLDEGDGSQTDLDIYYMLSTDQGDTWGAQVCVSNYTEDTLWRAYSDVSAMIDPNRRLHIIAPVRELQDANTYENNKSRMIHWMVDLVADTISKAHVIAEARYVMNGGPGGTDCDPDAWNMYLAKPSISLCDGKMYALFTQFGHETEPGALGDCSQGGFANGELYLAASDDYGNTWDTAWNLTKTRTPHCDSALCESDHWSSMARYGMVYEGADDTLDIMYINDKDAGGIPQGSGTWCVNNVMHYRFPCRVVHHIPKISLEPNNYGDPLHTLPSTPLAAELKMSNIGNAPLNVTGVSINYDPGNPEPLDWLTTDFSAPIEIATNDFAILNLTFNAGGVITGPDPSGWDADIVISHDDPSGSSTVPVHLTVATKFPPPQCDSVTATTKSLHVCNTGRLGGDNEGFSLDIPGDCDDDLTNPNGDMYLYDGSPMISWNDGSENLSYTTIFTQKWTEDGTFRPQSDLFVTSEANYNLAICTLSTTDSVFGVGVSLYFPTDGNDFVLAKYDFTTWKPGLKGMSEVYCGMILDWDIPADEAVNNFPGSDETTNTVWQRGVQTSTNDEDAPHSCPIVEDQRFGGVSVLYGGPPLNAWTAENAPMQFGSGMDKDSIYNRMAGQVGYNMWAPEGEDTVIDLHTGVTFDAVDMTAKATYTYVVALATSNSGFANFEAQIAAAKPWCVAMGICPDDICECIPGDANGDGNVNVGDAVYLISYVFKGGPAPTPYNPCSGDANCDCNANVGDAVYIISYVFKGGPPPCDCDTWRGGCGDY